MSMRWNPLNDVIRSQEGVREALEGQVLATINGVGVVYTIRCASEPTTSVVHIFASPDGPEGTPTMYGGTVRDYFRGLLTIVGEVGNDLA